MSNQKMRKLKAEVSAELTRLSLENDGLRPSDVVAAAMDKSSPLHDQFEWDNKKAGHEYRLIQARKLIRVSFFGGGKSKDRFVFIPPTSFDSEDDDSNEGTYRPISAVLENPDWYARALEALQSKMNSAIKAAEELQHAAHAKGDDNLSSRISVALAALSTANNAVEGLRLH